MSRAALTTLQIIDDEHLVGRPARLGALALSFAGRLAERFEQIDDVCSRGLIIGLDLTRPGPTDERGRETVPNPALAAAVLYEALGRGLSFTTTMGNVLTLTPPLVISEPQREEAFEILKKSFEAALTRTRRH